MLQLKPVVYYRFEDVKSAHGRKDPLDSTLLRSVKEGGDIVAVYQEQIGERYIIESYRYGLCELRAYTRLSELSFSIKVAERGFGVWDS